MGDTATDVILGCVTPESRSQLLPPSELLKRPSSDVPTYTVSGSLGSTARHRAPRSCRVSSILPFSTTATALSVAAYRRFILGNHLSSCLSEFSTQSEPVVVSLEVRSI